MGYGFVSESIRAWGACVRELRVGMKLKLWLEADLAEAFTGDET